jgi:hypothetical protein
MNMDHVEIGPGQNGDPSGYVESVDLATLNLAEERRDALRGRTEGPCREASSGVRIEVRSLEDKPA